MVHSYPLTDMQIVTNFMLTQLSAFPVFCSCQRQKLIQRYFSEESISMDNNRLSSFTNYQTSTLMKDSLKIDEAENTVGYANTQYFMDMGY